MIERLVRKIKKIISVFEYFIKIRNRGETDIRTNGQYRIVCVRQRMCGEGEPLVIEVIGQGHLHISLKRTTNIFFAVIKGG